MSDQRVLLDTNALLRLAAEPSKVATAARELIGSPDTTLAVSAVSAWEVSIKTRVGKLPEGKALLNAWDTVVARMRAEVLDISVGDAITAGDLPWEHRDPFDRLLVAQAVRHRYVLATSDRAILLDAPVPTLDTRP